MYVTSEIETMADCCNNIGRTATRKNKNNINFEAEQISDLNRMFDLIEAQLKLFYDTIHTRELTEERRLEILQREDVVNELRHELKLKSIDQVNSGALSYASSNHFMDMIEECERLADAITKVVKEEKL